MTADELREVLKEDAKIDFVGDDNTGDFKTIIWRDADLEFLEEGSEKTENSSPKSSPKTGEGSEKTEESTQKSTQKILELVERNPSVTISEMMSVLGLSQKGVKKNLTKLKEQGLIRRVGPDKGGHWEVVVKQ